MKRCATADDGLAFVREHGIVLASAKGTVPSLAEAIAGEPLHGSWWGHPKGHLIYSILECVRASEDVLACRLVDGKVTLIHRRLWPLLARLADRLSPEQLARLHEEHTPSGRHRTDRIPFADWVPEDVLRQAALVDEAEAIAVLRRFAPLTVPPNARECRRRNRA